MAANVAMAMLGRGEFQARSAVEGSSRAAGRVRLPGRRRVGPVHRQGQVTPFARAELLPEGARRDAARERPARRARGGRGDDRHGHGGRGAPPRAEPGQAPQTAVQRPAARRQVLSLHRGDRRGRVPAGHVHARTPSPRRRLLRPLRQREEGAGDARRPQPRVQVPALRGAEARSPLRHSVPRLPHRPVPGTVRRLRLRGRLRSRDRRCHRLPRRRPPHDRARARGADAGGGRRRALRGRRALPQPAVLDPPPRRAAGGRPADGRHGGRGRPRRRGRRGRGAGLPAPGRQAHRPLQLPPRERGRAGDGHAGRVLLPRVLRLLAERAARDPRARAAGDTSALAAFLSERRGSRVVVRTPRARREAAPARAGRAERGPRARVGGGRLRAEAPAARGRARGAPRGAEPREPADPHRVLRRLDDPGLGDGRLDGRVRGRGAEEGALPQVLACAGSTGRTTSRPWPR